MCKKEGRKRLTPRRLPFSGKELQIESPSGALGPPEGHCGDTIKSETQDSWLVPCVSLSVWGLTPRLVSTDHFSLALCFPHVAISGMATAARGRPRPTKQSFGAQQKPFLCQRLAPALPWLLAKVLLKTQPRLATWKHSRPLPTHSMSYILSTREASRLADPPPFPPFPSVPHPVLASKREGSCS